MTIAIVALNPGRIPNAFYLKTDDLMRNCGNNLGNLAFWYCTTKLIDETMCFISWDTKANDLPSDTKALVIPAANFLNEYSNLSLLTRLVREVDLPCVLIGIGAQSETFDRYPALQESTIQFMHEVSKRTSWIGVRGEYSRHVCESIGIANATALGCPSILINPEKNMGVTIGEKLRKFDDGPLAIHASAIKGPLRTVETELVNYTRSYNGSKLIIQRPPEFIKLMLGDALSSEDTKYIEKAIDFLSFRGTVENFRSYLQEVGFVPVDVESWIANLRHLNGAIGTRIHGTIMSLQALIPSLCVWHDTRTAELCQQLSVPSIDISTFCENKDSVQRMMRNVKFDGERFDALRIAAANRYHDIFEAAGIKPSNHLRSFVSANAPMPMKETAVLKSRSDCSAAAASVTLQPHIDGQACTAGGDPPVKLRTVEGYVDGIDGRQVSGWAYDKTQPDLVLDVEIHHSGQRIAVARADRLRADLARAGKGDGRHAFVAVLEPPISPDERNRLNVFARCGDAGDLVPLVRTAQQQQQQPAALNVTMLTPPTRSPVARAADATAV